MMMDNIFEFLIGICLGVYVTYVLFNAPRHSKKCDKCREGTVVYKSKK